ncbi:MAG: cytochrome c biogenesis protein CcdA [Gammaproteobacteria bacterium]|nr:MAG: cytochrome c biogenesis protein CcdA [Gammaproteobacteria bacterium]
MELSVLALPAIFLAGVVSFFSPCVLPLVPAYVSYISGESVADMTGERPLYARLPALSLSLFFVLGFSAVFIVLGASASLLGQSLLKYRYEINIIGGGIIIVFGLFMTGLLRIPFLYRDTRFFSRLEGGGPIATFVLGLAFGFGWTPCIGPVLGTILTASAVAATLNQGIALLSVYALGLGLPFLAAALFADKFLNRLKGMRRMSKTLHIVAGIVMIATGVAMITGYLSAFGFWLLKTFPAFSAIG